MITFLHLIFYLAHAALVPLLLIGLIRSGKARLQNRRGPSVLQPFRDMAKLLKKGETVSETTTWVFRATPMAYVGVLLAASLMTPWLGVSSPMPGDLFLVIYLLALGKFAVTLAALDTGSAFGGLGASRDLTVAMLAEPAAILALTALAVHGHGSAFAVFLHPASSRADAPILALLVIVALWLAALAELARMPIDDPATHLELTMIHESMILENSGRNLALMEYAAALKTTVLLGLAGQVALWLPPQQTPLPGYLLSLLMLGVAALVIIVTESTLVKLRWRRVPNLLSFAVGAGSLACLLVALKG